MSPNTQNLFAFRCTPEAKEFLLKEGTDPRYGARHLKRAIERHIVFPLSGLMSTGQIKTGRNNNSKCFGRRKRTGLFERSQSCPGSTGTPAGS